MGLFPLIRGKSVSDLEVRQQRPNRHRGRSQHRCIWSMSALLLAVASPSSALTDIEFKAQMLAQRAEYEADVSKTIIQLQQFRRTTSVTLKNGDLVTLTSLNPAMNSWFLLEIKTAGKRRVKRYHIENAAPRSRQVSLGQDPLAHLVITESTGTYRCIPWKEHNSSLKRAADVGLPLSPICGGRIFLRNKVRGSRTNLEATSEFLRDHVWLGENLVGFVKDAFFKDSHLETAKEVKADKGGIEPEGLIRARLDRTPVVASRIGLDLVGATNGQITMGSWYPVVNSPGIFASTLQPQAISKEILRDKGAAHWLDKIEGRAQAYLVAFDMTQFDIGYEVGTQHPRLDWSPRPHGAGRNNRLPGPDGIKSSDPLINVGMVSPALVGRLAATFTGGFKREHGAFRYGPYATQNNGTHYGFVVQGVTLSKLQPNLSTLYVLGDGTVGMKTWTEEDNKLLPDIRFARQNGVALVVRDPETGKSTPGPLVPYWGPGNWSGSAEAELRTLRAGACMRRSGGKQFLIYGYFSTATPSAMARSFQSVGCDYAMLLDMNALEHTYFALYVRKGGALQTQHLIPGMAAIDKRQGDGARIPRFLGFSDNRDFFYLTRKLDGK